MHFDFCLVWQNARKDIGARRWSRRCLVRQDYLRIQDAWNRLQKAMEPDTFMLCDTERRGVELPGWFQEACPVVVRS